MENDTYTENDYNHGYLLVNMSKQRYFKEQSKWVIFWLSEGFH